VLEPLSPAALIARIAQVFPDALRATPPRQAEPATPARKGEQVPTNLLATNDAVIDSASLPEVVRFVRDTLGYALLTNITAVDYLADQIIEVVYHLVRPEGGAPITLKVRVERAHPELPSLTPWWPGADFQEREAFDLYGVVFQGHPNLRRIYMWDEFEGFPMRKDFPKQGDKYMNDTSE
jgi:NADH-quinone oxidoreductase subunit C